MSRVPWLAKGSTCVEHLVHWPDPHGKNCAQQCAQASRAREDIKCESEAIRAMARDICVYHSSFLSLHFEIIDIPCKGVEQERTDWICQCNEVVYLSEVLQSEQLL